MPDEQSGPSDNLNFIFDDVLGASDSEEIKILVTLNLSKEFDTEPWYIYLYNQDIFIWSWYAVVLFFQVKKLKCCYHNH